MAAAKSAIAAGDWIALQPGEVAKYGSKNDVQQFKKAKEAYEAKTIQQFC